MFNRTTIHRTTTEVTPVTRVIEKSITPDKVTDVYKDVRKEVEDTILRTIIVEGNSLNGILMETEHRHDGSSRILHMRFLLNDKEYITKRQITAERTQDDLLNELVEFFSSTVTGIFLKEAQKMRLI